MTRVNAQVAVRHRDASPPEPAGLQRQEASSEGEAATPDRRRSPVCDTATFPLAASALGVDPASLPLIPAHTPVVPARLGDRLSVPHLLLAAFMMAAGVIATLPAWRDIYAIATVDEEYSHIFTVPLVALWLVYVRRSRIRRTRPTGQLVGVVVVAAGWAASMFGFYAGVQSFWHAGAVLVVLGCALSALGKNVLLQFFPAVLVLVFLVPVPGRIRQAVAMPLQAWTASTASAVLDLAGVPVEVSGNTLAINGTAVTVAEACNGVRMVFALTLVCYALAFAMPLRQGMRLVILLVSPVAALFCNIVRTLPTVLIYGYSTPEWGDLFHDYSGWAMLPLAFGLIYLLVRTLRWAHVPVQRFQLASQ